MLYNGIRLPETWPPRTISIRDYAAMPVPYLESPPAIIPIDVGRQLFVDDYLVEDTTLRREFHTAQKREGNPILTPETKLEDGGGLPVACPKDGGVWWDPAEGLFKMWYEAGWLGSMAYATSEDGIHWHRPMLDIVPGTNAIVPGLRPDSTTVFLDHDAANPGERFKMFLRGPDMPNHRPHGHSLVSADGIHWSHPVKTGLLGDRSTIFYNPFRKVWVYSIRSSGAVRLRSPRGRARYYREHSDFLKGAEWTNDDLVFWTGADPLDRSDPVIGDRAQLYNLSAVAYESIMLGLHQVHLGPDNKVCMEQGVPKITDLTVSWSRDGFHWHRPNRDAFIAATRQPGDWDRGYVQSVGGICTIMGDELWFYYTGFRGDQTNHNSDWRRNGMYANGSTGIATLRRDGFASMVADGKRGTLTTRPVPFNGTFLFVNTDCPHGELDVELLDQDHQVIDGYTATECKTISVDRTQRRVTWKQAADVAVLAGRPVRFRFHLRHGHLYAFWVSPEASGASHGYGAAGGPGFTGSIDSIGDKSPG